MIVICDHDNLDAGWRCAPRCGPPARLKITARKCARYWLHRTTPRLWRGAGRRFRWLCRGRAALRLRQRLRIVAGGVFGRDLYRRGRPPPWLGRALNRTGAGVGEAAGVQRAGVGYRHRQSGLPAPACGAGLCRNGAGGVLPQNAGLIRRSCFAADAPAARRAAGSPADRPRQYRTDPSISASCRSARVMETASIGRLAGLASAGASACG